MARYWFLLAVAISCFASVARGAPIEGETPPSETSPEPSLGRRNIADDDAELRTRVQRLESALDRLAAERQASGTRTTEARPALQPTILSEADYRVYPAKVEGNTGFALARLRPGLVLTPLPWFRAVSTIEFAGENPVILDAFMRLRAAESTEFTIGYSKPPLFASFVYEPVHTLPFPDRSPVVTSFRVRRDLGADVHFMPRNIPIESWFRVGNGTGSPLGNDNALPALYGALDLVLGRAARNSESKNHTYGLRAGTSALLEKASDRDGITGQTPLAFVYFRPIVVSGVRTVIEGHTVAYAGSVRLTIEGALANEARSRDDDGNPSTPRVDLPSLGSSGLSTELAWVVRGVPREVGRAPRGLQQNDGAWTGGAIELAARYDGMWLGRSASDVRGGGSQGGAVAVKWWPLDFLAATVSGYVTRFDVAPIEEPNERWSWGALVRSSFFWGLPG